MGALPQFDDGNFSSEVLACELPALIIFSATWCAPCQRQKPILESLADRWRGKVKIGIADIEKAPDTAVEYNVATVPQLLIFSGGSLKEQMIGFVREDVLDGKLAELTG